MEIRMPAADDLHVHLRNDARTPDAIRAVRHGGAARVLAMPNIQPAIADGEGARAYLEFLRAQRADFEILTTIKLTPATTPEQVASAARVGVAAVKQYPMGVTTNSEDGVTDVRALYPVYEAIQAHDLVLSLHGEVPGAFVMDAESAFLESLVQIHRDFPKLRIVLEHVTTAAAVACVRELGPMVAATITDHHLDLTLDDVVGSRVRPHHFCMPVAKRPEDRRALNQAVSEGHPSFFSGTDSAPHLPQHKECAEGCAGIFNAPFHLQFLATHFDRQGMLDRLQDFCCRFGREFYRLPAHGEEVVLIRRQTIVPQRFGAIVPFKAGQTLEFDLTWV